MDVLNRSAHAIAHYFCGNAKGLELLDLAVGAFLLCLFLSKIRYRGTLK